MKNFLSLWALAAVSFVFASCTGSINSSSLVPAGVKASSKTGQNISSVVSGGTPDSGIMATISDESFKQALETSLVESGLFRGKGGGGYSLSALIVSVKQPMVGISMTVQMEVSYNLRKGNSSVWSKSIKSSYSAPMGEAFVGAVRVRKATEGATRENIAMLIRALDEKL